MAIIVVVPEKGRYCCCSHKICTRIAGGLGMFWAVAQIVISSTAIKNHDHVEVPRGAHVAGLVLAVITLLCNLLLLMGNEKESTGCFCPWVVLTSIDIGLCMFLLVAGLRGVALGFALFMFAIVSLKLSILISVQQRCKEIKAKKLWERAGDQVQTGGLVNASSVANNQAGFVQVGNAIMPTNSQAGFSQFGTANQTVFVPPAAGISALGVNQTGFVQFMAPATGPNHGGFAHMKTYMTGNQGRFVTVNAPMATNEGGIVAMNMSTAPNQAGFVPMNVGMANNNGVFVPPGTRMPNGPSEFCAPFHPASEPPPQYFELSNTQEKGGHGDH